MDREEEGNEGDYFLTSPIDYKDRYQKFLYERETPHHDLVVPVRNNNVIVALFNFELDVESNISKFHIKVFQEIVKQLTPFIHYIIYIHQHQVDTEKELRYLLLRTLQRFSRTQRHELKNGFGVLFSSLREIELAAEEGDVKSILEEIEISKQTLVSIRDTSFNYTLYLNDYLIYKKIKLSQIINGLFNNYGYTEQLSRDNIVLNIDNIPDDIYIFCSTLAQEHIKNIIQNSIDAIINQRLQQDPTFIGKITVFLVALN